MQISRSAYYAFLNKVIAPHPYRVAFTATLHQIYQQVKGFAGYRIMTALLKQQGVSVTVHQVRRQMKKLGLKGQHPQRRYRLSTTGALQACHQDRVQRQFSSVTKPNQIWVGDITLIKTAKHRSYLAIVMDLFSRRIIGYAMESEMKTSLIHDALSMAFSRRLSPQGVIFHSDRGSQYLSTQFQHACQQYGILHSVSRVGNCYDNAVAESFFKTLKSECAYQKFYCLDGIKQQVLHYIEEYYNAYRPHSFNHFLSPLQKEQLYYIKSTSGC